MKWTNFAAAAALLGLGMATPSHAVNSINNNGTLLVTLDNNDQVVFVSTMPNGTHSSPSPTSCDSGSYTRVRAFTDTSDETEHFCDVTNIRAAGLNGSNVFAVGFSVFGLTIPGTLDVRGGSGNDTLAFNGDVSVGKLLVTLRGGNNRIRGAVNNWMPPGIGGTSFTPLTSGSITVANTLDIDTNNGNDRANFRGLTVGGTADINLGGGDDRSNIYGGGGTNSFNKLFMRLGSGDNRGSIRNTICHLCQVFTGNGIDDILLRDVSAGIDVDVIVAGGDDTVELMNVNSGTDVNANGGSGIDCLIDDGSATTDSNFEPCDP